jgi:hypothetical protein
MKTFAATWLLTFGFAMSAIASIPGVDQYNTSLCEDAAASSNSKSETNVFLKNKDLGWITNPVIPGGSRVLVALRVIEEADGSLRLDFSDKIELSQTFKHHYREVVDGAVRIKSCIVKGVAIYEIHGRRGFERVLHAINVVDPADGGVADMDRDYAVDFSGPNTVVTRSLKVSSPLFARAYNFDRNTLAAQRIPFRMSQPSENQADHYARIFNEPGQQLASALDISNFKNLSSHWSLFPQLVIIREIR